MQEVDIPVIVSFFTKQCQYDTRFVKNHLVQTRASEIVSLRSNHVTE